MNSDDNCRIVWEDCHYKNRRGSITIGSMFREQYAHLSIFDGLDPQQLGLLMPYMHEMSYRRGATVFMQGQRADCLYILLEGEVQIRYKPYDGPPMTVARVLPGGVFGWSAALGHEVYTSGAQAVDECVVYRIRNRSLQSLLESDPETGGELLQRLASVIAERLRNTHTSVLDILYRGIDPAGNDTCNHGNIREKVTTQPEA